MKQIIVQLHNPICSQKSTQTNRQKALQTNRQMTIFIIS